MGSSADPRPAARSVLTCCETTFQTRHKRLVGVLPTAAPPRTTHLEDRFPTEGPMPNIKPLNDRVLIERIGQ